MCKIEKKNCNTKNLLKLGKCNSLRVTIHTCSGIKLKHTNIHVDSQNDTLKRESDFFMK